jgi:hypothetical protein
MRTLEEMVDYILSAPKPNTIARRALACEAVAWACERYDTDRLDAYAILSDARALGLGQSDIGYAVRKTVIETGQTGQCAFLRSFDNDVTTLREIHAQSTLRLHEAIASQASSEQG